MDGIKLEHSTVSTKRELEELVAKLEADRDAVEAAAIERAKTIGAPVIGIGPTGPPIDVSFPVDLVHSVNTMDSIQDGKPIRIARSVTADNINDLRGFLRAGYVIR